MYEQLGMLVTVLLSVVLILLGALFMFCRTKLQYWKIRNAPHRTTLLPLGVLKDMGRKSVCQIIQEVYDESKHERYYGFYSFHTPQLLINDVELIKTVMVSEFMSFHDRGVHLNNEEDFLAAGLPNLSGPAWRNIRVKLTPTLTSGKIKMMFQTLLDTAINLQTFLEKPATKEEIVEIKDLMARYTTDVIASCGFGLEVNSLGNPECEFRKMGKETNNLSTLDIMKMAVSVLVPVTSKILKARMIKKHVETYFVSVIKDTIEYRQKNNYQRNDFMQLMMQLMERGYLDDADIGRRGDEKSSEDNTTKFTFNQAAAQAFLFFGAGFDTSATTLMFALYQLAKNQHVQQSTQEEIDKVLAKHEGKLSYEIVMEMHYLECVISESLRMYPILPVIGRECTKAFKLPDSDLVIEKGVGVQIPVYAIHHDPQYYEDPERFDPNRFTEEEKAKRHHFTYLPFGEGPRMCIGNRFALMQSKVALISVLQKYTFSVCDQTPTTIIFDPNSMTLSYKKGIHLKISKRS